MSETYKIEGIRLSLAITNALLALGVKAACGTPPALAALITYNLLA